MSEMPANCSDPNRLTVVELQQRVEWLQREVVQLRSQNQTLLAHGHPELAGHQAHLIQPLDCQPGTEAQSPLQVRLLDAVAQAIIATDLEGKILYWNHYAKTLYGWSASEVLGQSLLAMIVADGTHSQTLELMAYLQRGEQWSGELLMQRQDGTQFMACLYNSPVHDDRRSLIGMVSVSKDISDRKRSEADYQQTVIELEAAYTRLEQSYQDLSVTNTELNATLEELQTVEHQLLEKAEELDRARQQTEYERQRYQDLFDLAPDGYLITDNKGNIQEANQATTTLLCPNQRPDYLVGLPLRLFVSPQQLPLLSTWLTRLNHTNQVHSFELDLQASQHQQAFPVAVTVSSIVDYQGEVTGLRWLIRDITRLKQAEQSLQQANVHLESTVKTRTLELLQAERRWRTLLENVHLAVVGLDEQGQVTYANPFLLNLIGYEATEILNLDWFEQVVSPSQQSSLRQQFGHLLHQPASSLQQQYAILTRLGEVRTIAWNHTLLRDSAGRARGTMSIGEDMTERFAIDRIKAEFISVVSHELRTPLTAIHGGLKLIATGIVSSQTEQGQTLLKVATENSQRLVRLVNDILELERLESGKSPLQKKPLSTQELTQQIFNAFQLSTQQTGITLMVSDPGLLIVADCDRINQVLTNLLNNAIKFSPTNTTIWLTVEPREPTTVLFAVRDQGRGIPPEKCETIFDRFIQVDSSDSRQKGGTGLGLSICRDIVEQHGGTIWVESIPGEGSCFYFTLPVS